MRKHMILAEAYGLQMLLLEGRMDFLKTKYAPLISASPLLVKDFEKKMNVKPSPDIGEKVIDYVAGFDPDKAKKYTQWLLDLLMKRNIRLEDLHRAADTLAEFDKVKNRLPVEQRDIRRFKKMADLCDVLGAPVAKTGGEVKREYEQKMYEQADVILDNATYRIVIPRTKEASCFFGRNTQWCTAAENHNMFDNYSKRGPLYIVLDKKANQRWQFFFNAPESQFMDERDEPINIDLFSNEHTEIIKFFASRGLFFSFAQRLSIEGYSRDLLIDLENRIGETFGTEGYINDGEHLVFIKSSNLYKFVFEYGDASLSWAAKVLQGKIEVDNSEMPLEEFRTTLFNNIPYRDKENLFSYLMRKYIVELRTVKKYYGTDPLKLQNIVNDEELNQLISTSYTEGRRAGAEIQPQLEDYFRATLAENNVFFKKGSEWVKEASWNSALCVALPVDKIIEEMSKNNDIPFDCPMIRQMGTYNPSMKLPPGETSVEYAFTGFSLFDAQKQFLIDIKNLPNYRKTARI